MATKKEIREACAMAREAGCTQRIIIGASALHYDSATRQYILNWSPPIGGYGKRVSTVEAVAAWYGGRACYGRRTIDRAERNAGAGEAP